MAEKNWEKAKVVFEGVLNQAPENQEQYLIASCGEDKALLAEVKSLLTSLSDAEDFMESPAIEDIAEFIVSSEDIEADFIKKPDNAAEIGSNNVELVGKTIKERYLVEKRLDKGGFGTVYLARDLQIVSRPVVIKILHQNRLKDDWVVNKFRHEIEALARINHPGIVGILDTGELPEGVPFIVMQYVEGVTLRELIKPEGMDYERAAHIIKEICYALEEVHSKNIFHRDLKPENIMIRRTASGAEQVTIIDFGIAKVKNSVLAPSTVTKATAGTVTYMSPEQLNAKPVAATSDIYSLGMIFYEMLSGRRPFNYESIGQLFYMQQTGVKVMMTDLRPSMPERAQAIIFKALSFEPSDRYQNVRQFGDDLADALLDEKPFIAVTTPVNDLTQKSPTNIETNGLPTLPAAPLGDLKIPEKKTDGRQNHWRWIFLGLGVFLLLGFSAAVILIGFTYYQGTKNAAGNTNSPTVNQTANIPPTNNQSAEIGAARQLDFSLTVQKTNNSQPLGQPFESIGEEVFASGWKFRFNLNASSPGFVYVIDEGQNEKGENAFYVLYPTPKNNNGSARIEANQKLQTLWNVFDKNPGKEKVWFIWTAKANPDLEKIAADSVKNQFAVLDQSQIDFLKGLCSSENAAKTQVKKDSQSSTASIRGNGDLIVNFVELAHKPY